MNKTQLEQLYRSVIMDHYKNPRNKGTNVDDSYVKIHLNNPSCGDDVHVCVKMNNDIIEDIRHDGTGCSICCSSASVMTQTLINKDKKKALTLIKDFYKVVTGEEVINEELDEAVAYSGVSLFPARIKCATLSWKACEKALEDEE